MNLKSLHIENFQLFEKCTVSFSKTNLISAINNDTESEDKSGNGSGKTSLAINAVLFLLYGEVPGINLADLVRFNTTKCIVSGKIVVGKDEIDIERSIPNSLTILCNGQEIEGNTPSIKQRWLVEKIGDLQFFREFRMVDLKKGVNLLDSTSNALRQKMMGFIDDICSLHRKSLLAKKQKRVDYSIDKKLYKFHLSKKRLDILELSLKSLQDSLTKEQLAYQEQYQKIGKLNSEIQTKRNLISYKESDKSKLNGGYCPILKSKCSSLESKQTEVIKEKDEEIGKLRTEIEVLQTQINNEQDFYDFCKSNVDSVQKKINKAKECLLKLKEASKFSEYKYTKKDIEIFDQAIKLLDTYAAIFVQDWLGSLEVVINNLLRKVNINVKFSSDKDFIKITEAGRELKYELLSSGQKTLLAVVFKIAILLQKNLSGLLLIDEGIGALDQSNMCKLLSMLEELPFQLCLIYQNMVKGLDGVKYIEIERKNNRSEII